ncbi:MAG: zinc ribbon domain-containing protein [Syntrophobacteraceae bacterium]|nr:zinc ribbon domain-containing protein [Syntrophobacteraceae bacterium]
MPIYEYECLKCGKTAEAIQKFSDPPLAECCHCKGEVRKLISMSTFHLKGSGWYVTDYSGKNQGASSTKSGESKSSEKTEAKSTASDSPAPASGE